MINGYNFGYKQYSLYNPWDINNLLEAYEFKYYWADTGIPSSINEYIKTNTKGKISDIADRVRENRLFITGLDLKVENFKNLKAEVLLFYGGYLTINEEIGNNRYSLKYPNKETEELFLEYFSSLIGDENNFGKIIS